MQSTVQSSLITVEEAKKQRLAKEMVGETGFEPGIPSPQTHGFPPFLQDRGTLVTRLCDTVEWYSERAVKQPRRQQTHVDDRQRLLEHSYTRFWRDATLSRRRSDRTAYPSGAYLKVLIGGRQHGRFRGLRDRKWTFV